MNLTWNIVGKDLRALKWPLLVWALLIVSKLGAGMVLLSANGNMGEDWLTRMDWLVRVLTGMEFVSFILVAALIHEDKLVGTTAFWITRPISGWRLLRAKLLGLVLIFGVMPVVLTLPWWLYCNYGWHEIMWAAVETMAFQAIAVLLGMLWAVVTDGFARFLMWTLVLVFAVIAISGSIGVYLHRAGTVVPTAQVMGTRVELVVYIALLTILTVVLHQFLTRRMMRSLAVIGGAIGLMIAVGLWWPWSWGPGTRLNAFRARQVTEAWPLNHEPTGLRFTIGSAKLTSHAPGSHRKDRKDWEEVRIDLRVEGLPASQCLAPGINGWNTNVGSWLWRDGSTEKAPAYMSSGWKAFGVRQALSGLHQTSSDENTEQTIGIAALLSPEGAVRLQSEKPTFRWRIQLDLLQASSANAVGLQPGRRMINGRVAERVASVDKEGEVLSVDIVRTYPAPLVDRWFGKGMLTQPQWSQYSLVNRALGFVDTGNPRREWKTRVGTVLISWQTVAYVASSKAGGAKPLLEAINALDDAELVRVTYKWISRFSHEITIPSLNVAVPPAVK